MKRITNHSDHFTFVRIVYDCAGGNGEAYYQGDAGWIPRWATDHPLVFMSDPGWQVLDRHEQQSLKKYLDNGGFLWADDFWGQAEWENFDTSRSSPPKLVRVCNESRRFTLRIVGLFATYRTHPSLSLVGRICLLGATGSRDQFRLCSLGFW